MKILFTGASSFTGFWFARELANRGNDVFCALTKNSLENYAGIRRERLELLSRERGIHFIFSAGTQSECLRERVLREHFDVFCNHAVAALNHHDANYSFAKAVEVSTSGLDALLAALRERNCRACVQTGSYWELGESVQSAKGTFTAYAPAKNATWVFIYFWAKRLGMNCGKFVISNPIGPFEERGLTTYLAREWLAGRVPEVQTPTHIRDNFPVPALAKIYADFVKEVFATGTPGTPLRANPSGFVMTNEEWTRFFGEKLFGVCPEFRSRAANEITSAEPEICHALERNPNFSVPENFWRELKQFYENHYLERK